MSVEPAAVQPATELKILQRKPTGRPTWPLLVVQALFAGLNLVAMMTLFLSVIFVIIIVGNLLTAEMVPVMLFVVLLSCIGLSSFVWTFARYLADTLNLRVAQRAVARIERQHGIDPACPGVPVTIEWPGVKTNANRLYVDIFGEPARLVLDAAGLKIHGNGWQYTVPKGAFHLGRISVLGMGASGKRNQPVVQLFVRRPDGTLGEVWLAVWQSAFMQDRLDDSVRLLGDLANCYPDVPIDAQPPARNLFLSPIPRIFSSGI